MKLVLAQPKDELPPKAMKLDGSLSIAASSSSSPAAASSDAKSDGGSHEIIRFNATFKNGEILSAEQHEKGKGAFLKLIDSSYPPILAKLCVAFLSRAKLALGSRAADTRLVYDENNKLIGTVSIGLKDFHSMDQQKDHPYDARKLIECNIAEILVALHCYKDDDAHSGNVSPAGVFDADMWFYSLTSIFKGLRVVDKVTKRDPNRQTKIIAEDFSRFPMLPASSRTYWPTNDGMVETICKRVFANIKQFKALAANPSAKISGKTVTFHHQWYTAMLKQLLAFQPDKLLQDLQNVLGDELFDPAELDDYQKDLLKKRFPLFTDSILNGEKKITLAQLFLEFFTSEHQEFYNAVVRYKGEEHKEVSPIEGNEEIITIKNPSFYEFLLNNPSAYRELMQYFEKHNQETLKKIELAQQPSFDIDSERSNLAVQRAKEKRQARTRTAIEAIEKKYKKLEAELIKKDELTKKQALGKKDKQASDEHTLFDLEKIKATYHQVFKHSHQGIFNQLLNELKTLLNKLDDSQKLLLEQFIFELKDLINSYLCNNLVKNSEFRRQLNTLLEEKFPPVKVSMPNQGLTTELVKIKEKLDNQYSSINFEQHVDADDKDIEQIDELCVLTKRYDDADVINTFIESMFKYVDLLDSQPDSTEFQQLFVYAQTEYEKKSTGSRIKTLNDYVKNSSENCRQKLVFILSQGGVENNSFNTQFIYQIALAMLNNETIFRDTDMDLLPIKAAIHSKSPERRLKPELYAKEVQQHIQSNSDFLILDSDAGKAKVYNLIFQWANTLKEAPLVQITEEVLIEYKKSTHCCGREEELKKLARDVNLASAEEFLLKVFASKGKDSKLTRLMFKKFLLAMVNSRYMQPGYEFLYRIKLDDFKINNLLDGIEKYAEIKLEQLQIEKAETKSSSIRQALPHAASSAQQSKKVDPLAEITFTNWNTKKSALLMQDLLYRWVENNEQTFNTIMNRALTEYYKTSGRGWFGKSRYSKIESILKDHSLKPAQKLKQLFNDGGIKSNSFNTYALLGLYNCIIEQHQLTNDTLFQDFNYHKKCTYENTTHHFNLLKSYASQYVYKPAPTSSSPAAIASNQPPISLMFRSEVTTEHQKPNSALFSAIPK